MQRYKTNKSIFMPRTYETKKAIMFKIRINDRYDLRSNNYYNYDLGKPETNFMKKSFSYSAASLWNDLSITAKEKGISLYKFKRILDGT